MVLAGLQAVVTEDSVKFPSAVAGGSLSGLIARSLAVALS